MICDCKVDGHRVDMQLACAVSDNLAAVLRAETTLLEHMTKTTLLNRLYEAGLGLNEFPAFLGKTVKQVVHRDRRMKILEIGTSLSSCSGGMPGLTHKRSRNGQCHQAYHERHWTLIRLVHLHRHLDRDSSRPPRRFLLRTATI